MATTTNTTPTNEAGHGLPELPAAKFGTGDEDLYTADQVQQYAKNYAAALALSRGVPAERMAPVQGYTPGIPWSMHLEAYDVYCKRYGKQPALIDLEGRNCRGGFGTNELDMFIPGWRERLSEFNAMKARIAELEAMLAAAPAAAGAQGEEYAACCDTPAYCSSVRRCTRMDTTPKPAAADGGVRERAVAILAKVCCVKESSIAENSDSDVSVELALRAISAALSSHRQAGDDLSKFRELAEGWTQHGEALHANGFDIRGAAMHKCARELLALVEKGAGS